MVKDALAAHVAELSLVEPRVFPAVPLTLNAFLPLPLLARYSKSAAKTETQMSMKGGSLSASMKSDAAAVARSSSGAEEEEEEQQILSTPFALAVLAGIRCGGRGQAVT